MGDAKEIEVECNECDFKGTKHDLDTCEDDETVDCCPMCGSENLYYFK